MLVTQRQRIPSTCRGAPRIMAVALRDRVCSPKVPIFASAGISRFTLLPRHTPLALPVFEEFDLAEALLGLFLRFVRAAEVFPLLGKHFVTALHFFDHGILLKRIHFCWFKMWHKCAGLSVR